MFKNNFCYNLVIFQSLGYILSFSFPLFHELIQLSVSLTGHHRPPYQVSLHWILRLFYPITALSLFLPCPWISLQNLFSIYTLRNLFCPFFPPYSLFKAHKLKITFCFFLSTNTKGHELVFKSQRMHHSYNKC